LNSFKGYVRNFDVLDHLSDKIAEAIQVEEAS